MSAKFEPIVGRYMHLDLFGRPHDIVARAPLPTMAENA